MSEKKRYRGYIIFEDNLWKVKFPDFPTIQISTIDGYNPNGGTLDRCYELVVDYIIGCIVSGCNIPEPQEKIDYTPCIDIEVDVAELRKRFCVSEVS